ncbi:hypothetical protein PENNAL_c0775G06844, partial [Penicillium nalgiovense]
LAIRPIRASQVPKSTSLDGSSNAEFRDAGVISNSERPLIVTWQAIQGRGLMSAGYLGVNAASCVGTTLKHTMQRTGNETEANE